VYQQEKQQAIDDEIRYRENLMRKHADEDEGKEEEKKGEGLRRIRVYRNRISKQQEEGDADDEIDKEDHIIQFPWTVQEPPSEEEMKKRHEIRKEQGQKLKEIMQKKRQEKRKKMEEELAVRRNYL